MDENKSLFLFFVNKTLNHEASLLFTAKLQSSWQVMQVIGTILKVNKVCLGFFLRNKFCNYEGLDLRNHYFSWQTRVFALKVFYIWQIILEEISKGMFAIFFYSPPNPLPLPPFHLPLESHFIKNNDRRKYWNSHNKPPSPSLLPKAIKLLILCIRNVSQKSVKRVLGNGVVLWMGLKCLLPI